MPDQPIAINFSQGVNTKTDPWQLPVGQFQSLVNSIFTKQGLLQKRNGYGLLSTLPGDYNHVTTLNDNLTAIGPNIAAYNSSTETWITKGTIQPMNLSALPVIRNSINQIACDIVLAENNLACVVYTETTGQTTQLKYAIFDRLTGQNIVSPTLIPASGGGTVVGSARVFFVSGYFVIVYTNQISSSFNLEFISVSSNNATLVTTPQTLASGYTPSSTLSWDALSFNDSLYVAYNTTSGGQSVAVVSLSLLAIATGGSPTAPTVFTGRTATIINLCVDSTSNTPVIYASFYDKASSTGYTFGVSTLLATILAPTEIISSGSVLNITNVASMGICTVFYEVANTYSYDSTIATNFIDKLTITQAGTVSGVTTVIRAMGLASKAFFIGDKIFFLGAYNSQFQNSYFIIDGLSTQDSPIIAAKLAYENGGGYLTLGLPNVTVVGNIAYVAYLYKDLVEALNTLNNTQQTTSGGVYSQTGVNLATFDFNLGNVTSVEIANALQIGAGFGWLYDGYQAVESNFFIWPENVEATTSTSAITLTGTVTMGSNIITAVSSLVGVGLGAAVSGTGIPANQFITGFTSNTIVFGPSVASATHAAETITVTGNISTAQQYFYQAVYQWTDNQGNTINSAPSIPITITTTSSTSINTVNIPTLRETYKTNVKIVLYRWSTAQQEYFEVTSILQPTISSTTVDSITIYDAKSDAQISGNDLIYTTGGVVEDINPPASNIMTIFDTRVWSVDAEDPNLLWFSKQIIETTPVEWSDLFTLYVAPNAGVSNTTGPITALAPMDDKLIIFKENSLYYINGIGPDNTGANNSYNGPIFITATVGCTDPSSIVLIDDGLMFQSNKGIWLLPRGISAPIYIGAPVESFNESLVNSAVSVPTTNQTRMTLSTGQTLMFDYFYNQWGTFAGASAVNSCIYKNLHSFINKSGQVYQETPNIFVDGSNPVLMSLTTGWINVAALQGFERLKYFYLLGKFLSPCKIQVQIAYNYVSTIVQSSIITPDNFSSSIPSPFGDQPAPFGSPIDVMEWKIHARQQKCTAFQITVNELYDSTFDTAPGAGFTLSGINLITLVKRASRPVQASHTVG